MQSSETSAKTGYEDALAAVTEAYGKVPTARVLVPVSGPGAVSPWTPIYEELVAGLEADVQSAGLAYDEAADRHGVEQADRFDWRQRPTESA